MKRLIVLLSFMGAIGSLQAQSTAMYRLQLKDKGNSPCKISQPEKFLSPKSIERRKKQGFAVDETDLPIDPAYFRALSDAGAGVRTFSKWVNTIVVAVLDSAVLETVAALPFVKSVTQVWKGNLPDENNTVSGEDENSSKSNTGTDKRFDPESYGNALTQIQMNNGLPLHEAGYRGQGITIAVIDAGFRDADQMPGFLNPAQIRGTKNFSHQPENPYRSQETHGTAVLSCILANCPGEMIGTAPDADFYLLKTEISGEEYPVEEDYWVAAVEYADSLGVDIVTTSLGYTTFDDPSMNHTWEQLDGYTVPASRAASMAAAKGMVLFHSAGNEGNGTWQKVSIPADARNILTVGAVSVDSTRAGFSGWGYIADNRIKPDVMALGNKSCVLYPPDQVDFSRGTSFSTPIMAGMGACLWQALPSLTSFELMDLIKENSDRFTHPDDQYGYGIPNLGASYCNKPSATASWVRPNSLYVDTVHRRLYFPDTENNKIRLTIYSIAGEKITEREIASASTDLSFLPTGVYLALASSGGKYQVCKFIIR